MVSAASALHGSRENAGKIDNVWRERRRREGGRERGVVGGRCNLIGSFLHETYVEANSAQSCVCVSLILIRREEEER